MSTSYNDRESKILLSKSFNLDQIQVILNPVSSRLIDQKVEKEIEKKWNERLSQAQSKGIKIWNSTTYRLNEFVIEKDELYLELSEIDFKTRVGMKYIDAVYDLGPDYYSKGIFTAGLVKTSDNKYIFGELSGNTLSALSRNVDFIGGILSKDECIVTSAKSLAHALEREVQEEINIPANQIQDMILKAIILTSGYNIALIFDVDLTIDSVSVQSLFNLKNDKELKSLVFVEQDKLKEFLRNSQGYMKSVAELV